MKHAFSFCVSEEGLFHENHFFNYCTANKKRVLCLEGFGAKREYIQAEAYGCHHFMFLLYSPL